MPINLGGVKPPTGTVNKLGGGAGNMMANKIKLSQQANRLKDQLSPGNMRTQMQGGTPQVGPVGGLDISPSQLPFAPSPIQQPDMQAGPPPMMNPEMMAPQGGLDVGPSQPPFMPPPMINNSLPFNPGNSGGPIGMSSARLPPNRGMNMNPNQRAIGLGNRQGRFPQPRTY